jgi:hypothetical protein
MKYIYQYSPSEQTLPFPGKYKLQVSAGHKNLFIFSLFADRMYEGLMDEKKYPKYLKFSIANKYHP